MKVEILTQTKNETEEIRVYKIIVMLLLRYERKQIPLIEFANPKNQIIICSN